MKEIILQMSVRYVVHQRTSLKNWSRRSVRPSDPVVIASSHMLVVSAKKAQKMEKWFDVENAGTMTFRVLSKILKNIEKTVNPS
jgi:hypothetical protein